MSWIKITTTLPRCEKIRLIARRLKLKRHAALGLAIDWFVWLDTHSENGVTSLTEDDIDDELGVRGATQAFIAVGWVSIRDDGCVSALDFGAHNGSTAKKRATEAKKKANQRTRVSQTSICPPPEGTDQGQESDNTLNHLSPHERSLVESSLSPQPPTPHTPTVKPLPSSSTEVEDYLRLYLGQSHLSSALLPPTEITPCATRFYDTMEANGWRDPKGLSIVCWRAALRSYAQRWRDNLKTKPPTNKNLPNEHFDI